MRVGEQRGEGNALLEVPPGPLELVREGLRVEARQGRVSARVRPQRDACVGEPLQLLPRRDRLVSRPPRASADLLCRHERLRPDVCVKEERLHDVAKGVVRGDDEASRRKHEPVAGVEGEEVVGRERPEAEQAQEPNLPREELRGEIEPLLARLRLAGQPVVVQRDVRAVREAAPFVARRSRPHARPEGGVRKPQAPREAHEQPAGDPTLPARVEPRSGLRPRGEPRIGAKDLDGGAAAPLRVVKHVWPLRHPFAVVSPTCPRRLPRHAAPS
jgi:hypothetical protein